MFSVVFHTWRQLSHIYVLVHEKRTSSVDHLSKVVDPLVDQWRADSSAGKSEW